MILNNKNSIIFCQKSLFFWYCIALSIMLVNILLCRKVSNENLITSE